MSKGKGYSKIETLGPEEINARLTGFIEGGNETERTAARMMKPLIPLLKEIVESGDVSKLSGYVRGMSDIAASMYFSLPPWVRGGVHKAMMEDMERITSIPQPQMPRKPKQKKP